MARNERMLQSEKRITGRVQCSAGYFCIYNYLECFFSAAVKYRTFRIMFFVSTQKVA